ncbi:hypothetical protein V4V35_25710 [Bacillus infantis]|uniref:hypothetical protein n=1 Tax=Bacillus infantis TaxID=324767 RepID=UPI002FBDE8E7
MKEQFLNPVPFIFNWLQDLLIPKRFKTEGTRAPVKGITVRIGDTLPPNKQREGMIEMNNKVQDSAKEKIRQLLLDYGVAYIDYDARDDEYSIRLEKQESQSKPKLYADGHEL